MIDEGFSAPNRPDAPFRSVLSPTHDDEEGRAVGPPAYLPDLNLDQVVASIISGKQEYNLAPFFYQPLKTVEAVEYRQDVMRDLEPPPRLDAVNGFANGMRAVREHVGQAAKLYYNYQKLAWSLDAIELYGNTVERLHCSLRASPPGSAGLAGFAAYLDAYVASSTFQRLMNDATAIKASLASIRYSLLIEGGVITVSAYDGAPDYGAEVQGDFEKFKRGAAADHVFKFSDFDQMNHIEAGILERVARLYPSHLRSSRPLSREAPTSWIR